jgi:oligo-1,6-glucosidase
LVYGKYSLLDKDNPAVYAYTRELDGKKYLVLLNFTANEVAFNTGINTATATILINNYTTGITGNTLKPYQAIILQL